jgi:hypothetical protein
MATTFQGLKNRPFGRFFCAAEFGGLQEDRWALWKNQSPRPNML